MNIKQIYDGWKNLAKKHLNISDDSTEKTAVWRYVNCVKCEYQEKTTLICKKCGCYTPSKVRSDDSHCPIGKW